VRFLDWIFVHVRRKPFSVSGYFCKEQFLFMYSNRCSYIPLLRVCDSVRPFNFQYSSVYHHCSNALILRIKSLFIVQLSHAYLSTENTYSLTVKNPLFPFNKSLCFQKASFVIPILFFHPSFHPCPYSYKNQLTNRND